MTFKAWMSKVNGIVESNVGLSTDDLPDVGYYDMFEDGLSPSEAAEEALAEAMY